MLGPTLEVCFRGRGRGRYGATTGTGILALAAAGRQAATKSSSQRNHRRWSGTGTGTGLAHVELRVGGGPRRDESAQPGQLLCHAALALCYSCRCPVQSCRQRQPARIRILFTIYGPLAPLSALLNFDAC